MSAKMSVPTAGAQAYFVQLHCPSLLHVFTSDEYITCNTCTGWCIIPSCCVHLITIEFCYWILGILIVTKIVNIYTVRVEQQRSSHQLRDGHHNIHGKLQQYILQPSSSSHEYTRMFRTYTSRTSRHASGTYTNICNSSRNTLRTHVTNTSQEYDQYSQLYKIMWPDRLGCLNTVKMSQIQLNNQHSHAGTLLSL